MKCGICKKQNIEWTPSFVIGTCSSCGTHVERKPNNVIVYHDNDENPLYTQPLSDLEMQEIENKIKKAFHPHKEELSPYFHKFMEWVWYATADSDLQEELKKMDDVEIEDAFYRDLVFAMPAGKRSLNVLQGCSSRMKPIP